MLIILFGLAGSGKNFVGEWLQQQFGYHFWDADEALPKALQDCIRLKQPFTQAMRDEFTEIIIQQVTALTKAHPKLVIAQALYKEKNRQRIHEAFPKAQFVLIQADASVIAERLQQRPGVVDAAYANQIKANFDEPLLPHQVVLNNEDAPALLEQWLQMPFGH